LAARPFLRLTGGSGLTTEPALSPDGKLLAYASDRESAAGNLEIWVQPVQPVGGAARRLTWGSADRHDPTFSPDGTRLCYRSEQDGGGLWTVAIAGGEPQLLFPKGRRPRYSRDGKWIACWTGIEGTGDPTAAGSGQAYLVPAAGGDPRRLAPELAAARYPLWAPDGKHLLVAGASSAGPGSYDWWVTDREGGPAAPTGAIAILAREGLGGTVDSLPEPVEWRTDTGGVLFSAELFDPAGPTAVWEMPVSERTWKVTGRPKPVTMGSGREEHAATGGGRMAFAGLAERWSVQALEGDRLTAIAESATRRRTPSISVDGSVLVEILPDAIKAHDLRTGTERALVRTNKCTWARVTADGSKVFYVSSDVLHAVPSGGGEPERRFAVTEKPWDVSPDGRWLLVMPGNLPRGMLLLDTHTGARTVLLTHPTWNLYWGAFSADGRWVAFTAKSGPEQSRVFVAPFDGTRPSDSRNWIPVTGGPGADTAPRWSPDGKRLYYFSDRDGFRCIWSVGFDHGRPIMPVAVHHFHEARYSLSDIPVAFLELAAGGRQLVLEMRELTGNIWVAP
jgi:Tol biopolymer transport system component